jgi:DNA-binding HxlR family transcriptional regulator
LLITSEEVVNMAERGVGSYQINRAKKSVSLILNVLKDGKWHRFSEIQKATGLSTATLSKHLKMLEGKLIKKKIDIESGERPIPIYYGLSSGLQKIIDIWQNFLLSHVDRSGNFWLKTDKPEKPFQSLANLTILAFIDLLKQQQNTEYFEQAFQYSVLEFFEEGLKLLKQKLENLEPQKRLSILEKIEQNLAGVKIYE